MAKPVYSLDSDLVLSTTLPYLEAVRTLLRDWKREVESGGYEHAADVEQNIRDVVNFVVRDLEREVAPYLRRARLGQVLDDIHLLATTGAGILAPAFIYGTDNYADRIWGGLGMVGTSYLGHLLGQQLMGHRDSVWSWVPGLVMAGLGVGHGLYRQSWPMLAALGLAGLAGLGFGLGSGAVWPDYPSLLSAKRIRGFVDVLRSEAESGLSEEFIQELQDMIRSALAQRYSNRVRSKDEPPKKRN